MDCAENHDNHHMNSLPHYAVERTCDAVASVASVDTEFVEVEVVREACAGCNGRCLGFAAGNSTIKLPVVLVDDNVLLRKGDVVSLSTPRHTLIGFSLLVYLLPIVLMLLFAVACDIFVSSAELAVTAFALGGLAIGAAVSRIAISRFAQLARAQISVVLVS